MSNFLYTVFLPGLNKTVHLRELYYTKYKELTKTIINDNNDLLAAAFDRIITELCVDDITGCTFIDKLLILLAVRSVCISPILELTITCPVTDQTFDYVVEMTSIFSIIENIHQNTDSKTYFNNLPVVFRLPSDLYIQRNIEALETVIVAQNKEGLPAAVLKDAKKFIKDNIDILNDIELLTIHSPYVTDTVPMSITANIFNGSVIEFLKLIFKRDLMSIYKHEYFLIKHLNFSYDTLAQITPAEAIIHTNLFSEEQKEKEKARSNDSISISPP